VRSPGAVPQRSRDKPGKHRLEGVFEKKVLLRLGEGRQPHGQVRQLRRLHFSNGRVCK